MVLIMGISSLWFQFKHVCTYNEYTHTGVPPTSELVLYRHPRPARNNLELCAVRVGKVAPFH